jgi:hypothetical protein
MNVGRPHRVWIVAILPGVSEMLIVVKIPEKVKAGVAKGHYWE